MQDYNEWIQIAEAQSRGAAGHDGEGCLACFYTRAVPDTKETEIQGRPIFNSVPFVEIRLPGDKNAVVNERVNEEHKRRWPAAWAAYEEKRTGLVDGTPIEEFPLLDVTQVATLRHCGIRSIEQLAAVSDGNLPQLGPDGRKLRERAKQHLQGPKQTEKDLREKIRHLEVANSDLEAKLRQLMAAMPAPHSEYDDGEAEDILSPAGSVSEPMRPRPRGRPRKVAA